MMQAIEAVFPKSRLQRCIVHQVRSSTRYVSYKDIKKVVADLKKIYSAVTLEEAEKKSADLRRNLAQAVPFLCEELGGKLAGFKHILRIPRGDSENHIHDEQHRGPEPPVPADHEKNKPSFTNDDSLRRMLYLASQRIVKHWHARCQNWDLVLSQLEIMFADRAVG